MNNKTFVIIILSFVALITYLFVSAPPTLPETEYSDETIPFEVALGIAEAENDVVRALWTKEIVGAGKEVGLAFHEDWRETNIDAGPLPALFLRETANSLEKNPIPLSLFLGSDFPINDANRFDGIQKDKFDLMRSTQEPQFFYSEETQLYTAMFPDTAVSQACIDCHNAHEQSPKNDWELEALMGATTWAYPHKTVTLDELMLMISALRQAFRDAYAAYLAEVATFPNPPEIGDRWPRDGYYLPTIDIFMDEIISSASPHTLEIILKLDQQRNVNDTP
jgi:hypothetical protein